MNISMGGQTVVFQGITSALQFTPSHSFLSDSSQMQLSNDFPPDLCYLPNFNLPEFTPPISLNGEIRIKLTYHNHLAKGKRMILSLSREEGSFLLHMHLPHTSILKK